jgi:hypothetical protein
MLRQYRWKVDFYSFYILDMQECNKKKPSCYFINMSIFIILQTLHLLYLLLVMKKIEDLLRFLNRNTPVFQDETHKVVLTKDIDFKLPKSNKFATELSKYLFYLVCSGEVDKNYIKKTFKSSTAHLWVLSRDMRQICGFAFFQIFTKQDFLYCNQAIANLYHNMEFNTEAFDIRNILYLQTICSKPQEKAGEKLLGILERSLYKTLGYDAVALHSTPSRYTYYVKKGFFRTNDFKHIYPVIDDTYNNSGNIRKTREIFEASRPTRYVYFTSEYDIFLTDVTYLFMKPIHSQSGGTFKRDLNEVLRTIQGNPHQSRPCCT